MIENYQCFVPRSTLSISFNNLLIKKNLICCKFKKKFNLTLKIQNKLNLVIFFWNFEFWASNKCLLNFLIKKQVLFRFLTVFYNKIDKEDFYFITKLFIFLFTVNLHIQNREFFSFSRFFYLFFIFFLFFECLRIC